MGHLPFAEHTVITPTGSQYVGVNFAKKLCGVSIIRSGESMENALRACCKGIKIGKILVHRYSCIQECMTSKSHSAQTFLPGTFMAFPTFGVRIIVDVWHHLATMLTGLHQVKRCIRPSPCMMLISS